MENALKMIKKIDSELILKVKDLSQSVAIFLSKKHEKKENPPPFLRKNHLIKTTNIYNHSNTILYFLVCTNAQ